MAIVQQIDTWGDDGDTTSWLKVSVPFLLCGLYLVIVWLFLPAEQWLILFGMMVAYIVPPLGRETIIPVCILCGIPWWLVAFTLAFLDFAGLVSFVSLHFDGSWCFVSSIVGRLRGMT